MIYGFKMSFTFSNNLCLSNTIYNKTDRSDKAISIDFALQTVNCTDYLIATIF